MAEAEEAAAAAAVMGTQYSSFSTMYMSISRGTGAVGPVHSIMYIYIYTHRGHFTSSIAKTRPTPTLARHARTHARTKGLEQRGAVLGRVELHLRGRRVARVRVAEEADGRRVVQRQRLANLFFVFFVVASGVIGVGWGEGR